MYATLLFIPLRKAIKYINREWFIHFSTLRVHHYQMWSHMMYFRTKI